MNATSRLLKDLDGLPYGARARTVARWGQAASPQELDAALATLAGAGAWERSVAVTLAAQGGRWPLVLSALADPSRLVRRAAAAAAAQATVAPAALVAAALAAPATTRKELAQAVHRAGAAASALALADGLLARGDVGAARPLLGWCPEATLEDVFQRHGPGAVSLRAVAAKQPALVARWLATELAGAGCEAEVQATWRTFGPALEPLAQTHAVALLDAWEHAGPFAALPTRDGPTWAAWLRTDAARALALLARALRFAPTTPVPVTVLHRAAKLPVESVHALARALAVTSQVELARLLDALPPSRRAACFEAAFTGQDLSRAWLSEPLLTALPHALRHAHARRQRMLPRAQRDERVGLGLLPFLPAAEARAALEQPLRAPQGEVRADAWLRWGHAVLVDRTGLEPFVAALPRLANEQDPVRAAATQALAALPGERFAPAQLAALEGLTAAAAEARDTSAATRAALIRLAHRLLVADAATPSGPRFQAGLRMLLRLAGQRPVLQFPTPWPLSARAAALVVDALGPWFDQELARDVAANVLALAEALGDRGQALSTLQARLEELAFTAPTQDAWVRSRAVHLWLRAGRTRDARVRKLLDWDESAVTLFPVWAHLHRRRQDWLDPFLEGHKLRGRFASEKTGWLFPALDGFQRWLPRQQRRFQRTLQAVVDDAGHHAGTRALVLRRLAALPVTGLDTLRPALSGGDVVLAEAALGGTVWLDDVAGVDDVLLAHAGTERARVAIYALGRLLGQLPDARVDEVLRRLFAAPELKLTSLKEAVRLFGGRPGAAVTGALAARWADPKTHRDVRGALVHAARRRLDDEAAWALLEAAAVHPERALAEAALAALAVVAPAHRARAGRALVALFAHAEPAVRRAALQAAAQRPGALRLVAPAGVEAAFRALASLEPTTPWPEAAQALAAVATLSGGLGALEPLVRALVPRAQAEPLASTEAAEDLPSLRRLAALLRAVAERPPAELGRGAGLRALLCDAAREVLGVEEEVLALSLAALQVDRDAVAPLQALASELTPRLGGPALAAAVEAWVAAPFRAVTLEAAEALGWGVKDAAPWVALGVVKGALGRLGALPALRGLLGALRAHPVTAAAARRAEVG